MTDTHPEYDPHLRHTNRGDEYYDLPEYGPGIGDPDKDYIDALIASTGTPPACDLPTQIKENTR